MSATASIEVAFKGNRKDFFLWEQDEPPPLKAAVIVDADRGEDLGFVHALGELAEKRNAGTPHGYGAAGTAEEGAAARHGDDVARAQRAARRGRRRAPPRDGAREGQRSRDEALRRRVAVGSEEAHAVFHGRAARRLPHAGARAGVDVPHAHRAEADRRARRSQAARRHRPLRPAVLLVVVAAGASAGEPRRGEGPAAVAQSVADLRARAAG